MATETRKKNAPLVAIGSFLVATLGIFALVKTLRAFMSDSDATLALIPLAVVAGVAVAGSLFALVGSMMSVFSPGDGGPPVAGRPH